MARKQKPVVRLETIFDGVAAAVATKRTPSSDTRLGLLRSLLPQFRLLRLSGQGVSGDGVTTQLGLMRPT